MTIEEIRELIQVVIESGVAELEVQRGDDRVRIRRSSGATTQEILLPGAVAVPATVPQNALQPAAASPPLSGASTEADAKLQTVRAPIVGTFYESPSPGAPPFVKVGDTIRPGQVLCIIESMKLMNEIEAEVGGVVQSKLVENGSPIEYGEALFTIRQH